MFIEAFVKRYLFLPAQSQSPFRPRRRPSSSIGFLTAKKQNVEQEATE
jgi:hypothetical protein